MTVASGQPYVSLDARIRADLGALIRSGDWPPGYRIPTESELMAQYACARMTVSKAIAALVAEGLIERRKKAGSFVSRPLVQTAVLEIPDIPSLVASRGESYRFQVLERKERAIDKNDPDETGLEGPEVLSVHGIHFAGALPFALEQRILNLSAAPAVASQSFESEPPGSWLLKHVAWTEASHRITAINADAAIARHLAIPRGRACLRVGRMTWRPDGWITFVRLTFPGDRYELLELFTPSSGMIWG